MLIREVVFLLNYTLFYMNKSKTFSFLSVIIATLAIFSSCDKEEIRTRENTLWYQQAAANWDEALPVGNGRIGAMVFGDPWHEIIQLNEESLWAGCQDDGNAPAAEYLPQIQEKLLSGKVDEAVALGEKYLVGDPLRIRSYQSFGNLNMDFEGVSSDSLSFYERRLDLEYGIATTKFVADGVTYTREVFTPAQADILVIRFKVDKRGTLNFRVSYSREKDAAVTVENDNTMAINGQIHDAPIDGVGPAGDHMKFSGLLKGFNKGGTITASDNSLVVSAADEVVFYMAMHTDYNFDKLDFDRDIDPSANCHAKLQDIQLSCYNEIRKQHISEHSALFNRVSLNIGDPAMKDIPTDVRLQAVREGQNDPNLVALYFQYGRYMLMDSSREPGCLPANLQGIWCKDMDAAWNSDFHTNINIQMNYWPAEICNLSECAIPYSNWINKVRVPGRVTAQKTFGAKGWTINHVSNPFGHTSISDGLGWGTYPIAASWLTLSQWEHYLFTCDEDYLRTEAYPSMKEAAEFLLSFMIEDKNGYLVTAPSNSPENGYRMENGEVYRFTYGATHDVEIINELFLACIKACNILNTDADFKQQLETTMKRLPPVKIGKRYNTIQEWIEDYEEIEPGHRHMSHLFGLHPGTTINDKDTTLYNGARRTLERRRKFNEDPVTRQGSYTGWSRAWLINFYARLKDSEEVGANVNALLAKNTENNLFDSHPPFQIDGNFGGTAGIAEALLQSHAGEIHLLPALPTIWGNGDVKGLRARGGVTVDMQWSEGKLQHATLTADKEGEYLVRYQDSIQTVNLKPGVIQEVKF